MMLQFVSAVTDIDLLDPSRSKHPAMHPARTTQTVSRTTLRKTRWCSSIAGGWGGGGGDPVSMCPTTGSNRGPPCRTIKFPVLPLLLSPSSSLSPP